MSKLRGVMALIGALAAGCLYLLGVVTETGWLSGRPALAAALLAGVFFGGLLLTAGKLGLARAALRAAVVGLAVAALATAASMRFAAVEGIGGSAIAVGALAVLVCMPWPFVLAAAGRGWRDYPSLFGESWGIVVRVSVALVFTGLVWLVLFLSQALLGLVGVTVIEVTLRQPAAPWLITGTVLGLAMAVVNELADVLAPGLVLRLLRLLLPVVLLVTVVFLAALPVKGLDAIFGLASSATVLLGLTAAAVTLVTSALDEADEMAVAAPLMVQATRVLAALAVLPAGLAGWAVWLRVSAHGWTPPRLTAATFAAIGLAYGVLYLAAVLRGRGWMARIRQANIGMALAVMVLSALWLSALNPEAISSRSQVARILDGRTAGAEIDLSGLQNWGLAGQAGLARLQTAATTRPDLAARLKAFAGGDEAAAVPPDPATLRAALAAALPVVPDQPATRALRDRLLALLPVGDLQGWQADCDARLPQGGPGCVLVVADFLPLQDGDEAMLLARGPDGYMLTEGFALSGDTVVRHPLTSYDGDLPQFQSGEAAIATLQAGLPPLMAVPLNQITVPGQSGLLFAP